MQETEDQIKIFAYSKKEEQRKKQSTTEERKNSKFKGYRKRETLKIESWTTLCFRGMYK